MFGDPLAADGKRAPETASVDDPGPQLAQASTAVPVGRVTVLQGTATATHADARVTRLKLGDPIYEGDVVETGPGSSLAITFIDKSVVTLSENARIVIEVLIYDPADNENLLTMTMVQGDILLFSGEIAATGRMLANTPVGQLDITGTGIFAGLGAPGGPVTLVLVTAGRFTLVGPEDSTAFQVLGEALSLARAAGQHPEKFLKDLEELVEENPALFDAARIALSLVQQQLELEPDGEGLENIIPEAGGGFPLFLQPAEPDEELFDPLGPSDDDGDDGGPPPVDPPDTDGGSSAAPGGPAPTTAFRLITAIQELLALVESPPAAPETPGGEEETETETTEDPGEEGGAETAALTSAGIFALLDSLATDEDTATTPVNVLAGAASTAGGLSVSAVTDGSLGTVAIEDAAAGLLSFSFPPGAFDSLGAGASVTDSFTYTLTDSAGATLTQSVTVTIAGLNDAPSATPAAAATLEDGPPLDIDVAGNIADPDTGAVLTVSAGPGSNGGTTTVAGTVITFTAAPGFYDSLGAGETATETFDYTVTDDQGATDTATVTVTIAGVNDAPSAQNATAALTEDDAQMQIDLAAAIADPDQNAVLTVSAGPGSNGGTTAVAGTLVTFTPVPGVYDILGAGQTATETFDYTVIDDQGASATATVTVTIDGVNDGPSALNETGSLTEDDAQVVIDLAGAIADPDQNAVLTVSAGPGSNGGTTSVAGTLVTFTPATGFYDFLGAGQTATETFAYTVTDDQGASAAATVTVTIDGVNDGPSALDETASLTEDDAEVAIDLAAAIADPDQNAVLTVSAGPGSNGGTTAVAGTVVTFTPAPEIYQSLGAGETATETFAYTVTDDQGESATATVTVAIEGLNDPPSALDQTASLSEDDPQVVIDLSGAIGDPDQNAVLSVGAGPGSNGATTSASAPPGTLVTFTPVPGFYESLGAGETATETFAYTVSDDQGATVTATVTVTVEGENDAPTVTVTDPAAVTESDSSVPVTVTIADQVAVSDPDASDVAVPYEANSLAFSSAGGPPPPAGTLEDLFTLDLTTGTIGYDRQDFNFLGAGQQVTATFAFTSGSGPDVNLPQQITLTIDGENDVPTVTVTDPAAVTESDASAPVTVTIADQVAVSDPDASDVAEPYDANSLAFSSAGGPPPPSGTLEGLFTLDPIAGTISYDRGDFNYLGAGQQVTATFAFTSGSGPDINLPQQITLTIDGENDAPTVTVTDPAAVTESDASAPVTVTIADQVAISDPDASDVAEPYEASSLAFSSTGGPPPPTGTLEVLFTLDPATGTISYDRGDFNYLGAGQQVTATFTFTSASGPDVNLPQQITLTIEGENDAPLIELDKIVSVTDGLDSIPLSIALPVDPDNDALRVFLTALPENGTVRLPGGRAAALGELTLDQLTGLTFDAGGGNNADSFITYLVDDENGGTVTGRISTEITGPETPQDVEGGPGNDILRTSVGDDTLTGLGGDDDLRSRGGDDTLYGGDGQDSLDGGEGEDLLDGGASDDRLYGGGGDDSLFGGNGEDRLDGGEGDDLLRGGARTDHLYGDTGDDTLEGGDGIDLLYGDNGTTPGEDGDDGLYGGEEGDTLYGDDGDDTLFGGQDSLYGDSGTDLTGVGGDDTLYGEGGQDRAYGDAGTDLNPGATGGNDLLYGGASEDQLYGDAGGNLLDGAVGGSDNLSGGEAGDRLYGDAGDELRAGASGGADTARGGEGADFLFGDAGSNLLADGAGGADLLYGGDGDDRLYGDAGGDIFPNGAAGADTLYGEAGQDVIYGDAGSTLAVDAIGGADLLYGGADSDTLYGDGGGTNLGVGGGDTLYGDDGEDTLIGSRGGDTMTGGAGADRFLIAAGDGDQANTLFTSDLITDFTPGSDVIGLVGLLEDDVLINNSAGDATIAVRADGEVLAVLAGVQAADVQVGTDVIFL